MSLLNGINASASALRAMQQVVTVTQQNLLNASTPGYAKQRTSLEALPFDPARGLSGGVKFALPGDTRSQYAESAVWREVGAHTEAKEYVSALMPLEPLLTTGDSGVTGAMRSMFSAAAAWGANPNDGSAREAFLGQARGLTHSFRAVGDQLQWMMGQIDSGINATVSDINRIVAQLRDAGSGAAQDATAYTSLEELAAKAGITARREADGSYTVALSGQATILTGSSALELKVVEGSKIISADGVELTSGITGGKLKGLLDARAEIVSLIGDANSEGDLNRLASTLATQVNDLLGGGLVSPGPPPVPGRDLFTWDNAHPNAALLSLTVSADASAGTLAPYDPGPPPRAAGIALQIARLDGAPAIGGQTFEEFFGGVALRTASRLKAADTAESTLAGAVETAVQFRSELSGVSMEEEAVTLLATQRAYEASAAVLKVLDELLETTIGLIR